MGLFGLSSPFDNIRALPRETVFNRHLILTCLLFASAAVPLTWDQGSSSLVPSLKGFQSHFGITSGDDPAAIRNFESFVFIGSAVSALLSFFCNDRFGRLWSMRLYVAIWTIGQLIAIFSPNTSCLYASRIVSGLGIGALTVVGPISLVEIAPAEIRGLLTSWFTVMMGLGSATSTLCVYGVDLHVRASRLQYQAVWFVPFLYLWVWMVFSFYLCESPRWLFLVGRKDEGVRVLCRLRALSIDHERLQAEVHEIESSLRAMYTISGEGVRPRSITEVVKETFTVPSNLRRVQQVLICYAIPQLSGANSVSSYFVSILKIIGRGGGSQHDLFLTCMYNVARLGYSAIASFLFIDIVGRRKSLFTGITLQMIGDLYIASYLKVRLEHTVTTSASEAAIALIFIHSFGYSLGLLTLPYVFGGELWPNHLRSFGASISASFHWIFSYAMVYALPSLLERTENWGAFVFFASWCAVALIYVYFVIPELKGVSVEEMEEVFRGSWFTAYRTTTKGVKKNVSVIEGEDGHLTSQQKSYTSAIDAAEV